MPTTYIATCREWPQGNADLRALAAALHAELLPWQDITPAAAHTVLPLAAWDYSTQPDAYLDWLAALEAANVRVINPPALQRWNLDKRYLCELAAQGLGVTPGIALLPGDDWMQAVANSGWDNPVVKPLIGQSGRGVRRLDGELPTLAGWCPKMYADKRRANKKQRRHGIFEVWKLKIPFAVPVAVGRI